MRKRVNQVNVRLSDDELAVLNDKMELTGLSYSALIRKLIRYDESCVLTKDEKKTLLANIGKIGSNINQIARVANSTKGADTSVQTEISYKLDQIWRHVKAL